MCEVGDYWYGLTMAAIEQIAQQGLACVTHMTLEVTTASNHLSYLSKFYSTC